MHPCQADTADHVTPCIVCESIGLRETSSHVSKLLIHSSSVFGGLQWRIPASSLQGLVYKILQARLQQYVNHELPDVQAGFRKGRGTRDQIVNICWIMEKAREFQKNIYFCFIEYAKAFDCVDHNKLWKILKEMGIQATWPASWEICMQVKKQQIELDMEQQTGSKLGKEYIKAVYCHPAYLTWLPSLQADSLPTEPQGKPMAPVRK